MIFIKLKGNQQGCEFNALKNIKKYAFKMSKNAIKQALKMQYKIPKIIV